MSFTIVLPPGPHRVWTQEAATSLIGTTTTFTSKVDTEGLPVGEYLVRAAVVDGYGYLRVLYEPIEPAQDVC